LVKPPLVLLTDLFDLLAAVPLVLHRVEENQQSGKLLMQALLCREGNCPRPVRRVKPLGKRGVISSLRNPRKASSDTRELSGLRDPKNSSVRVNRVAGKSESAAVPPSAAGDWDIDASGCAADAAPATLSHMTKTMMPRDCMVRLLSHKNRDRCAHL
jgi:hypothetical protein